MHSTTHDARHHAGRDAREHLFFLNYRPSSAVSSANTLKRARTALYLVATSSQYQVER